MAVTDYIAIRGFSASGTEVFQGIGAGSSSETTATPNRDPGVPDVYEPPITSTPISEDTELAEGLWQGQNAKLEHESDYCDQLQRLFKQKQQRVNGIRDKFIDLIEEFLSEALGEIVGTAVSTTPAGPVGGFIAGVLTEFCVEWALDELILLFTRGNELLDGIKAENKQLLNIEKNRENYEYRERVIERHREDIRIILEQIRMAEGSIKLNNDIEMRELLMRLTDLALRDDTIELGNMRLHSKGRVVNF